LKLSSLNNRLPKRSLLFTAVILYLLSFLTTHYFSVAPTIKNEGRRLEKYIHNLEKDYALFLKDTVLIKRLALKQESLQAFKELEEKPYGIFLVNPEASTGPELIFWNNQLVLPPLQLASLPEGDTFMLLSNGYYLVNKQTLHIDNITPVVCYATIPIQYRYDYQQSSYLQTHFVYDKDAIKKIAITEKKTPTVIRSLKGKPLFHIEQKAYTPVHADDLLTALLRVLAFVLLMTYIHFVAVSFTRRRGALRGTALLLLLLLAIRITLLGFPNLFSFRQFELFDPTVYSANLLNRSMGDLLINALFFCWFVVFVWYNIGFIKQLPSFLRGYRSTIIGIVALLILILSTFQFADVVRSLVADSNISFNVIDFFSLSEFTVFGFLVLALLSLSYYYFSRILFYFIFPAFKGNHVYIYFALALTGLILLSIKKDNQVVLFQLPILLWLVIYTLLVSQAHFIINRFRVTIAGILFWIFIFSISLAGLILQENRIQELNVRKGIADKYDQLTTPSGTSALNIALTYLDNEFLGANLWRFKNSIENEKIRDSIKHEDILGYANRYDIQLYVFDEKDQPINNEAQLTYAELNNILNTQSRQTGMPGHYYHERSFDQFTYITKRTISDSLYRGTFFIISTPKRYNRDALYPELFRRTGDNDPENSPLYSYAVYSKGNLIKSSTQYPFKFKITSAEIPKQEYRRVLNEGYDELWYRANTDKVVMVAKKQNSLLESITLFSYLFCAFLFLVALMQLVSLLLKAAEDSKVLNAFWQPNIRSQVHSTIIFISILLFLVIGVATISFFINRYNRNNVEKLSRTSGIMVKEMQKRLIDFADFDNEIKIYDPVVNENLKDFINNVADVHNVDVNVYDTLGNLQVSSEDEVYNRGILSTKMHPEAYYHLNRMKQVQYVQEENMSSLRYLSIYAAVRDEKGEIYAYLNIPYFLSQIDLNQEISNFLVTIINLNAFIFLIAGVIALFITNRITRSFSIIGDKMKEIQLGKTNEEIVWNRNDEIGELVRQYNKMVHQLEDSASALAKSEREGAWREMARQVAHEIKNPLTPMKLSIQYLQKAITDNQPNVKELTTSVANTLVEQIDHLSKIAADFARFANIGFRQVERFDLHYLLENLIELNKSNPNVTLHWNPVHCAMEIEADKTHMNRLFTNLLTNAIEACDGDRPCVLQIDEEIRESSYVIKIKDNGTGIPAHMQSKIFTPNFTTKSSGTGLGLAMSKSIVEQAGGSIWFENNPDGGTTFFVQLPAVAE
jgi:two-component system nitrogen regulation sensor histidine kinase NtrY